MHDFREVAFPAYQAIDRIIEGHSKSQRLSAGHSARNLDGLLKAEQRESKGDRLAHGHPIPSPYEKTASTDVLDDILTSPFFHGIVYSRQK